MKLRLSTDLLSGLLFLALGVAAITYAANYPLGTINRMGAGYFPRLISIGLIAIGAILLVRSLRPNLKAISLGGLRPLLFILLATLSFGLTIERFGLLVSGVLLVIIARLASRDFRLVEVAILAIALVTLTSFLFRTLLGLSIPVLPR